ncbi:MAG TPA: hypothetical protein VLH12_08710 [Usitatibacter sp.]|nr:hypothetical protein [Usitatibacter sp.]
MNRREAVKVAAAAAAGVFSGSAAGEIAGNDAAELVEATMLTELQPGDVLVVKCDEVLSHDAAHRLRESLENTFPGTKAIVLCGGLTLEVMRGGKVRA